jgi:hypothetical protein
MVDILKIRNLRSRMDVISAAPDRVILRVGEKVQMERWGWKDAWLYPDCAAKPGDFRA